MSWLNDVGKLINGLSLVAKEITKRSQALQTARTGDVETLISSSLKKALVSATEISGLTRGTVREFTNPKPKESIVYFNDSSDVAQSAPSTDKDGAVDQFAASVRDVSNDGGKLDGENEAKVLESSVEKESFVKEFESIDLGDRVDVDIEREATAKRRRPRERKVPSTPFSRLLG